MILIAVFALNAGWLPAGGFPPEGWAQPAEAIRSLVLPVVTIALVMSASLIRYVRSATLDVLDSDYLRTARALGSSFGRAMWRRGLRNASVPVISILGIELASTLLGAVVVESVYALPGLGSMLATGSGRVQGDPSNSLANTVSAPGVLLGNLPYGHGISAAQHQCPGCGITSRPS
jgi:peptide/nickel transport system permease protein